MGWQKVIKGRDPGWQPNRNPPHTQQVSDEQQRNLDAINRGKKPKKEKK